MNLWRSIICVTILSIGLILNSACRTASNDAVTIVTSDKFSGLDTISTTTPDAAADRIRTLMYNSLVKKK